MKVVIAGCGIGGLAVGLALRRAGMEHVVLEQAPELMPIGAGIQLSPNCVRILEWLGLGEQLSAFGVLPEGLEMREHDTGELMLRTPLGPAAREAFGASYYHAHRADLLDALVQAHGMEEVRLGVKVEGWEQSADGVEVRLAGGDTVTGDVLIGADGIHSVTRQRMHGPDRPRFSGLMALRGLVPAERIAHLDVPVVSGAWMGPHRSLVHYYVSGGKVLNWIGIVPAASDSVEAWDATGTREEALRQFEGWHETVRGMIAATEAPFRMAMYDRDPLPHWVDGRVALLGDACHSMLPFHAQGAAMSIEDAWVIARCLEEGAGDVAGALRRYQSLRYDRANWVARFSREAEQLFHMADPEQRRRRRARLAENQGRYESGFPPGQVKLYGYDAEAAIAASEAA